MLLRRLTKGPKERWQRTLLITFFAQLITAVGFSSIFPFLPLYVETLGTSTNLSVEVLAGLVYSGQAFTMMAASPIWGALSDRFGRKLMVTRSMFGGALILFLMAFVRSAEELVLMRAIQGLVTGTVSATNALVASEVPRERTGYAMGMMQVGLSAGVALGPLIGGAVADAFGYRAAFYANAALLLIAGLLVLLGVEEVFVPVRDLSGTQPRFTARWKAILAAPGVPMTYGVRFLTQFGRMMILPIIPFYVQSLLSDTSSINTFTGLVVGVAAATATVGALVLGRLSDRIGHKKILLSSMLLAAVFYFPQSLVRTGWQLLLLQALVGVAMGGFLPSISSLLASYTRQGDEGAVYGLDNSIRAGARALAPLIGSGVMLWLGLRATFVAASLVFLLTSVLAAWHLPSRDSDAMA